jgi:hypothetical protein
LDSAQQPVFAGAASHSLGCESDKANGEDLLRLSELDPQSYTPKDFDGSIYTEVYREES